MLEYLEELEGSKEECQEKLIASLNLSGLDKWPQRKQSMHVNYSGSTMMSSHSRTMNSGAPVR